MTRNSDNSISFGVGLLAGVIGGVVAGVLYSPKPGEEMRSDFVKVAKSISEKVAPDVTTAKEVGLDMIDKVKGTIELQLEKLNNLLKANKLAAAKLKEEEQSGIEY